MPFKEVDGGTIASCTNDVTKTNPQCHSDKQINPCATSLIATYETTRGAREVFSAILGDHFSNSMAFLGQHRLEKTHDMCLGMIKIQSLKKGGKI